MSCASCKVWAAVFVLMLYLFTPGFDKYASALNKRSVNLPVHRLHVFVSSLALWWSNYVLF